MLCLRRSRTALDLRVKAAPFEINGEMFSIEIISRQQLVAAENGTLSVLREDTSGVTMLNSIIQLCQQMQVAKNKTIKLTLDAKDVPFKTDIKLNNLASG